jgi:Zn-dependent oligopeptidase
MLADDGYQWFVEQGGLTRENGQKFREAILSRGNSQRQNQPFPARGQESTFWMKPTAPKFITTAKAAKRSWYAT